MKKIVALIRPFDYRQKVLVYEDGNEVEQIYSTISDLSNIIFMFSDKYSTQQVDLVGPNEYSKGICRIIEGEEFLKYNSHKLNINII